MDWWGAHIGVAGDEVAIVVRKLLTGSGPSRHQNDRVDFNFIIIFVDFAE